MNVTDDCYHNWPLVMVIIGGHEPQWVADTLARVNALDEDALVVIIGLMVKWAREEAGRN